MNPIKQPLGMLSLIVMIVIIPFSIPPLHAKQIDMPQSTQLRSFDDMPKRVAHAVTTVLQDTLPAPYRITRAHTGFCATNPAHNITVTFRDNGPILTHTTTTLHWALELTRWGRGQLLKKAPSATITAAGPRIEYTRGASL